MKRLLKNYAWEFDENTKGIWINDFYNKSAIYLGKTHWFSLFRFMIRASQRMSGRHRLDKRV